MDIPNFWISYKKNYAFSILKTLFPNGLKQKYYLLLNQNPLFWMTVIFKLKYNPEPLKMLVSSIKTSKLNYLDVHVAVF